MQCKKRCKKQVFGDTNKAQWEAIHNCVRDQMTCVASFKVPSKFMFSFSCRPVMPNGCDAQHTTLKNALQSCTGVAMPNLL